MHDEDCPYYSFSESKVAPEIRAYETLKKINIRVPELMTFDAKNNYLIKEFIDGRVATELIIGGKIKDSHIKQLFRMADKLKSKNLNIDYFPNNFVISAEQLYYVDYELNTYSAEWNLENWGLYYRANAGGMKRYLEQGDILAINSEPDKGIPVKAPFREQVREWVRLFGGDEAGIPRPRDNEE